MPKTNIVIYQEKDGTVPLLAWLDGLPGKVQDKCIARIELLKEKGYDLRRPICDSLRDGIYELRAGYKNVNYRILYCFQGKNVVLLSHGCTKERKVPGKEIDRAIKNATNYTKDKKAHTYTGEL
ncbi:MAG: type II toxin-antitoxin system RelE/ParE family toxin [Planctomycetota bacterium]|nr:MAG: type II toxin-antitoxin system RelE/ParE family toxin [Planctomycetota bacterium]